MITDDLTELMHSPQAQDRTSRPDLPVIVRRGRRLRRGRRARAVLAAGAVVAIVGVATAALGGNGGNGGNDQVVLPAARPAPTTAITAYEQAVLDRIPGAYAVNGTVVLADRAASKGESAAPAGGRPHIVGTPVALGFDGRSGPGYIGSITKDRAYQRNAPQGSQVVIDPGPVWLGCTRFEGEGVCRPSVLAKDDAGSFYQLFGIGGDDFLEPGARMELFIDYDWSDSTVRPTLVGGFAGTGASRVEVDLVDGSHVDATLAAGTIKKDATLFWTRTDVPVARVRALATDGSVLESHQVRACSGRVDCEVR